MVHLDARAQRIGADRQRESKERLHDLQGIVIDQRRSGSRVSYHVVLGTHTVRYSSQTERDHSHRQAIFRFRREGKYRNPGGKRVETTISERERYSGAVSIVPLNPNARVVINVNTASEDSPVEITTRTGLRRRVRDTLLLTREQLLSLGWDVDPNGVTEKGKLLDMLDYGALLRYLYDFQQRQGEFAPN